MESQDRSLQVGDLVNASPVGPGEITGFTERGCPQVNHVAVSWLRLENNKVWMLMDMPMCACGLPLHYSLPEIKEQVDKLVAREGEYIDVTCEEKTYKVQRHYIALHGLKGHELPELVRLGHVEEK